MKISGVNSCYVFQLVTVALNHADKSLVCGDLDNARVPDYANADPSPYIAPYDLMNILLHGTGRPHLFPDVLLF